MSQRFIASARFLVPEPPPTLVVRPHLVERLSLAAAPTTLIVGAPGAGKTAVVGEWVRQRSAPTAWLSCDPTDEDPARFWAALALAIQRIVPEAGVDALKRLDEDGSESVDMAANLASDCEFAEGLAIVVDDFHHAGPSAAAFSAFVRSLPGGARIVLVSRHDPGFPVGRLRVQGRLLEIRDADLRFAPDEAAELLTGAGIEVGEQDLARLCDLTEGWAAGLQLAALALAVRPDVAELVSSFAASDRGVTDFLVNEVIDAQPPEIADFMMRTSVMDSFDATSCDAVTDREDSADLLMQLHRNNLFVVALDRRAGWFRYHHLFGAFLQARLLATSRQRYRQAHAAASRACSSRGDMMSAVRHAMAADDLDGALELVRAVTTTTLDFEAIQAGIDTIRAWLRTHGERYLESDPSVVLECCIVLAAVVSSADAEMWMRRVEQRHGSLEVADAALLACAQGLLAVNHGDADTAIARIEEARRVVGDDVGAHFWVSQSPIVTCHAHLLRGDVAATRRAIADARAESMPSAFADAARFPGMLAWAAVLAGELTEAARQSGFAISTMQSMGLHEGNLAWVLPRLSLAAVAREQDDLSTAADLLDAVIPIAEHGRRPPLILLTTLERARLAIARGDIAGGRAMLDGARGILPTATPEVIDQIDRHVARIAVDGRDPRAAGLVDTLRPTVDRTLLRARLAIDEGDASSACELLDTIDDDDILRARVQRGLLAARALRVAGDRTAALGALERALRLAEPVGLLRLVIEEGADLHELLGALPTDDRLARFVDRVLDGARRRAAPAGPGATHRLADPLSEREVEVLRYLASRLTYGEIAGQLYISVNTLKSHVKAVYRKLGVATRAEAVTEGQRVGLL